MISKRYAYLIVSILTIDTISFCISLNINLTRSLPQTVFLIIKDQSIYRGSYLAFYPPINTIYKTTQSFIKIVGGISGDVVREEQGLFYVNNRKIGYAKSFSSKSIPLTKAKVGVIPKGYYFVYSPHPDSFDSRYAEIGLVPQERIIGRAFPLF